jgi:hypothetical protein
LGYLFNERKGQSEAAMPKIHAERRVLPYALVNARPPLIVGLDVIPPCSAKICIKPLKGGESNHGL